MDQALKAKWVGALRSGEYQQSREGWFEHKGAFCCLGVLCKVAEAPIRDEDGSSNWFFVDTECGLKSHSWHLACLNDSGASFPKIADYIEANL